MCTNVYKSKYYVCMHFMYVLKAAARSLCRLSKRLERGVGIGIGLGSRAFFSIVVFDLCVI